MFLPFLIALALSADCFAVSFSGGIRTETPYATAVKFAVYFGAAQALMFLLGWFAGAWFRHFLGGAADIAAFAFLAFAGLRMLAEGLGKGREAGINLEAPGVILGLAAATSLDALFAGTGLSIIGIPLVFTASIVGIVAFLASFAGVYAGDRIGGKFKKKAEMAGGIILIIIGLRILV